MGCIITAYPPGLEEGETTKEKRERVEKEAKRRDVPVGTPGVRPCPSKEKNDGKTGVC